MLQHLGCEVSFGVGSKMASAHPPIPRATPIATTPSQHLPQSFFARPAEQVAPELIGCLLVKRQADGELLWGVIVETEAYSQQYPLATATAAEPPVTKRSLVSLVLCLCELWHSPLRQASPDFKEHRLGLIFECCQRVSQPNSKPRPEKLPDFPPRDPPQLRRATSGAGWLGWISGAAVVLDEAASHHLAETAFITQQQRDFAGPCAD